MMVHSSLLTLVAGCHAEHGYLPVLATAHKLRPGDDADFIGFGPKDDPWGFKVEELYRQGFYRAGEVAAKKLYDEYGIDVHDVSIPRLTLQFHKLPPQHLEHEFWDYVAATEAEEALAEEVPSW